MLSVCNDIFYSLSYQLILSGVIVALYDGFFQRRFFLQVNIPLLNDFPRKVMSLCTNSTSAFLEHLSNRKTNELWKVEDSKSLIDYSYPAN